MPLIDIKSNPSRKDLTWFGLAWVVFFLILGKVAFSTEHALLYAAAFTGMCFLISICFNRDFPIRSQLLGLAIPLSLLVIWGFDEVAARSGIPQLLKVHSWSLWKLKLEGTGAQWGVFFFVLAFGVLGGLCILASNRLGAAIYRGWMFAALPLGWTISHAILALVYFGVMTPIGLVMRAAGKDPMTRRLDPHAKTYWIPHAPSADTRRYFRQF